ncbi:MAG: NAD-dependent epimerase/dehydratase family protein [Candidatus Thorarchaeota archaeon]
MRVLLTGATGFIGSKLAQRLVTEGHSVRALVRKTSDVTHLPKELELHYGDVLDTASLESAVAGIDAVMHLAAYFDFYPSDVGLLYRVNVDGTRELMNACVGTNVERFIYCSTTEVIGPVKDPPGNEDTELNPQFHYSKSKAEAERVVREISSDTGVNHIILRPTGVMGEGDLYTAYELLKALNDGEVPVLPGKGDKHIMYTHVDDVVEGFVKALSSRQALNRTIILCPDYPMTYAELIDFVTAELGVSPPRLRIPTRLAMMGIGLLSPIKNRKKNTFLWHMKTVKSMDEDRWYSNERAKTLLEWSPRVTMQEGIRREIEWCWANGLLERRRQ